MATLASRFRQGSELDPRVWQMAFARAINTAGMSLVMAFLGVYVVEERGYPAWLYGLCALAANLVQSVTSAWAGELSDRVGRRPLITGSLTVRAAVIALLGVQVLLDAPLWTLAVNFVASSALRGCFEPVAYALVADVVTPDQRIAAYAMQRMGTNLGWALGPALGGLLTLAVPYGVVFFVAAGGLLAAAWQTRGVPESRASLERPPRVTLRASLRAAAGEPAVLALLSASFLAALVHTQMFSTLAIFLAGELGFHKVQIGVLYMVNGFGVLLLQLPAIRVIERIGVPTALTRAAATMVVGYAAFGVVGGLASAVAVIVVITCAEVVFAPAHQAAVAQTGDPARRGQTFGVMAFAQSLGIACAPLLGGLLFDALVARHPLLAGASSTPTGHVAMWGAIAGVAVVLLAVTAAFGRATRAAGR